MSITENLDGYYRLAYSYTKNQQDAMDIVQESLYKALKNYKKLREPKTAKTWFYRIVINTAIDHVRKENRNGHLDDEQWVQIPAPEKKSSVDYFYLKDAIEKLSFDYKTIIILRYFEDMKLDEISAILGKNVNTVKTRLYAALKKLRIQLEDDYEVR
jgi:RNA polymerase sigma-70 factor (ECF subfamily)